MNLSEEWRNALTEFDWDSGTMKGLYTLMDLKLEIYWPSLKRIVDLLTSLKKAPHKSHIQFLERVQKKMLTGGVGSKSNFSLDWDKLLIVLILKGLPVGDQNEVLKKFDTLEVSLANLSKFLQTLSVVSGNSSNQGINSISSNSNNSPNFVKSKMKTASIIDGHCTRCSSINPSHINRVRSRKICNMPYCHRCDQFFHDDKRCKKKNLGTVNTIQG